MLKPLIHFLSLSLVFFIALTAYAADPVEEIFVEQVTKDTDLSGVQVTELIVVNGGVGMLAGLDLSNLNVTGATGQDATFSINGFVVPEGGAMLGVFTPDDVPDSVELGPMKLSTSVVGNTGLHLNLGDSQNVAVTFTESVTFGTNIENVPDRMTINTNSSASFYELLTSNRGAGLEITVDEDASATFYKGLTAGELTLGSTSGATRFYGDITTTAGNATISLEQAGYATHSGKITSAGNIDYQLADESIAYFYKDLTAQGTIRFDLQDAQTAVTLRELTLSADTIELLAHTYNGIQENEQGLNIETQFNTAEGYGFYDVTFNGNTSFDNHSAFQFDEITLASGKTLRGMHADDATRAVTFTESLTLIFDAASAALGQTALVTNHGAGGIVVGPNALNVITNRNELKSGDDVIIFDTDNALHKKGAGPWSTNDLMMKNVDGLAYSLTYTVNQGDLTLTYIQKDVDATASTLEGLANGEAAKKLWQSKSLTGDALSLQNKMELASSTQQASNLAQQFTPSMTTATPTLVVQANRSISQQINAKLSENKPEPLAGLGLRGQNSGDYYRTRDRWGRYVRTKKTSPSWHEGILQPAHLWAQGFAFDARQGAKEGYAGFDAFGTGLVVGVDQKRSYFTYGAAYAYSSNKLDSEDINLLGSTPNRAEISTHTLLGYGKIEMGKRLFASAQLGYTWGEIDGRRSNTVTNDVTYATTSGTLVLQTVLGLELLRSDRVVLTPKIGLNYYGYEQNSYTESTGDLVRAFNADYTELDFLFDSRFQVYERLALVTTLGYRYVLNPEGIRLGIESVGGVEYFAEGMTPVQSLFICDAGGDIQLSEHLSLRGVCNLRLGEGDYRLLGGTGMLMVTF